MSQFVAVQAGHPDYYRQLSFAVKVAPAPSGCLNWTGKVERDGYGRVWWNGAWERAHRRAYEIANGPIPPGMMVCHRCDNPLCCNPAHLFLGTAKDNTTDSMVKGRHGSLKQAGKRRGPYRLTR